jgi:hypothetical protein
MSASYSLQAAIKRIFLFFDLHSRSFSIILRIIKEKTSGSRMMTKKKMPGNVVQRSLYSFLSSGGQLMAG